MMRRFVLLLSVAFLLAACAPYMAQQEERSTQYPAMNLSDDSYDPGPGWTLVWSDEFDSETLDLSKD